MILKQFYGAYPHEMPNPGDQILEHEDEHETSKKNGGLGNA